MCRNIITILFGLAALFLFGLAVYQKWVVPNPDAAWHLALAAVNMAIFYGRSNDKDAA